MNTANNNRVTYTEGAEQRRPEQVVEHLPGLTPTLELGKEGLMPHGTHFRASQTPVREVS